MTAPVIASVSGVRGVVGKGLIPQLIVDYSAATGTFFGRGKVMVGRDSRVTGEMVKGAVLSGLMAVGCDPVDLGVCPTPTVQLAVQNSDAVGGIVITASHNPVEWNALKLVGSEGLFLDIEEGKEVQRIIDEGRFRFAAWDEIGKTETYDKAVDDHITVVLDIPYIDIEKIRKRKFRVAFDCVNGAGGTILPGLLEAMGCEQLPLNAEPHGCFAHTPEPVPENIQDLCRRVRQTEADIGFAVDPDVDRLAIVAETGKPIGEEYTIVLAARFMLSKKKGDVVINVSTTRAVEDVAKAFGGSVIQTPVGEIHVAKKMKEIGAVVGGEGNGGVLLPEVHLGRDAPVAIALTLQHLVEYGGAISQLWRECPQYTMTKKKIEIGKSNPDEILQKLIEKYRGETLNLIDGVKIDRQDSWIHIRKSNTEPIVRVMAEAPTREKSEALCGAFLKEIKDYAG